VRDRQLEEDEIKALEKESEELLKQQMAEMAALEDQQRKAGLLTDDAKPIKVALAPPPIAPVEKKAESSSRPRPGVTFDQEDEELDPSKKKRRTLVKLEYDESDGSTEAERIAKRNAKLLEVKAVIPRDRRALWHSRIEWAAISEVGPDDA
jgi:RNA-binding protein 25